MTKTIKDYEAERAARGNLEILGRLTRPVTFVDAKNGAKIAYVNIAHNNSETKKTDFLLMSLYISKEKVGGSLEEFYAGLKKGQLVSIEYTPNEKNGITYNNIYTLFPRQAKAKTPVAAKA